MKLKSFIPLALLLTTSMVFITGCQKGDLIDNPNLASASGTVPATLILNNLTANLIKSDEYPFNLSSRANQYFLSNYSYYWGNNNYNYGGTEDSYNVLKYAIALQAQSTKQIGNQTNKYYALGQFFKAYAGIWLTQRVGDIPFSQAGNPAIVTPKYDTQHDVYKSCLALLNSANAILAPLVAAAPNARLDNGDIFALTYLQWQKLINTYTLRVLISLSKRVGDPTATDLNIASTFNTIVSNPTTYPIMTGNSDDLIYVYNSTNTYPVYADGNAPYDNFGSMGLPYVTATAGKQDPRIFVVATPAPAATAGGKQPNDFTAYVGADDNTAIGTLNSEAAGPTGAFSYASDFRYFVLPAAITGANAEPFVFIGYPEMCFNIAEAINLGWVTGQSSATWYVNGINASLATYKLTNGETLNITSLSGNTIGTATVNIPQFMANVAYAGDNAAGLAQIFTQRYVAMFLNSGWEPFYQWRRSVSTANPNGLPAWSQGGPGIGTVNGLIPRRWEYPANEAAFNTANYKAALSSQFGGSDDPTKDTWLTK